MRKKDTANSTAWLRGYYPDQETLIPQEVLKDEPVSTGLHSRSRIQRKRYTLMLSAGIMLLVTGFWIVAQQWIDTANLKKADADLRSIYYTAARQEAEKLLAVNVSAKPNPSAKPVQTTIPQARSFVTPIPMLTYLTRERFLTLLRLNSDVIGWLAIQNVLDLPVVQRDNSYYLTHSFLGKTSYAGTLFLDQNFSIVPPHENLLIHGHNMRDGSMFGQLLHYREKSFYTKNWLIEFETLYENGRYVVFAVFDMVNDLTSPEYYPFSYRKFDTDLQFDDYIAGVKRRSLFQCEISVLPTDTLLTLSTCAEGGNHYLVIVARKIRDDESLANLTMACLMSEF